MKCIKRKLKMSTMEIAFVCNYCFRLAHAWMQRFVLMLFGIVQLNPDKVLYNILVPETDVRGSK